MNHNPMPFPVYLCLWCGKFTSDDPQIAGELECTCFPIHGQYLCGLLSVPVPVCLIL